MIGFIGLGTLGKTIAKRLIECGESLIVWNRTIEKAKDLDAEIAESPKDLAQKVDKIFIIVFDSQASEEVIFGNKGIIEANIEGKTIVDMTTNHPAYSLLAHEEIKRRQAYYIDAPVLGSVIPASKGLLTMVASGDEKAFNEVKPVAEKFCSHIFFLGKAGNASKMKLINNIVLGGFMDILAEAIAIGENLGFDKSTVIEVLSKGAGKSAILEAKREKIMKEDFSTHFSVDLIYKDLHYAQDMLKENKLFSFSLSAIKETFGIARNMGLGDLDFSAVYKVFKNKP